MDEYTPPPTTQHNERVFIELTYAELAKRLGLPEDAYVYRVAEDPVRGDLVQVFIVPSSKQRYATFAPGHHIQRASLEALTHESD